MNARRIIGLGLVMDAVYQGVVFRTFYPVDAVIIALALAFLPTCWSAGRSRGWRAGAGLHRGGDRA